ncbi:hypothetical protein D9M73_65910 [compost metagenome]|nr:MAG TPA: Protein of unknown function (DUF2591) [Caudoviricetes sp.]
MKHKTAELEGDALDYLVQCAEHGENPLVSVVAWAAENDDGFNPSTNWEQGGRIIERERISVSSELKGGIGDPLKQRFWFATYDGDLHSSGPTVLIAAMREYVASKLGDEVELP